MTTVADIKEQLKAKGIAIPSKALKADLLKLLEGNANAVAKKKKNVATNAAPSFLSDRNFTNANVKAQLSNATFKALTEGFGYVRMSKVQASTLEPLLAGEDIFAKSKTGSGKTLAFLVPIVEAALRDSAAGKLHAVVISPTKELAAQTHQEAVRLLQHVKSKHRSVLVVGGHNKNENVRRLNDASPIAVLVATPGRLVDHIQTTPSAKALLQGARTIVLDEADRMLDQGFRRPLETILNAMSKDRQTVLISATMPADVKNLANAYLKKGWKTIDVTGGTEEDDKPVVNQLIQHRATVAKPEQTLRALAQALSDHIKGRDKYKVIVFSPFVKMVQLMTALLRAAGYDALEIHSDLNQNQRDRVSDTFRKADKAILLGTDVIARGVDYPDVSLVVQMGMTDKETYVHRVGRTGRGGKSGEAVMIVSDFEEPGLRKRLADHLPDAKWTTVTDKSLTALTAAAAAKATKAVMESREGPRLFGRAYTAWIGTYASKANELGIPKTQVLDEAARAFKALGLDPLPEVSDKLLNKMGFRR